MNGFMGHNKGAGTYKKWTTVRRTESESRKKYKGRQKPNPEVKKGRGKHK